MNSADQSGILLFQPHHPCFQILVSFLSSLSSDISVLHPLSLLLCPLHLCHMSKQSQHLQAPFELPLEAAL
jgi:hypothetical protein